MDINHPPLPAPCTIATSDRELLDNLDGQMHGPIEGFFKKHFGRVQLIQGDNSSGTQPPAKASSSSASQSAPPSPDDFLRWFHDYTSQELNSTRYSWLTSNDGPMDAGHGTRHLLTTSTSPSSHIQTQWGHVQVIGQSYPGRVYYQDGLLRLYRTAHQVFDSQPTRLFLHGFYIRGSLVEFWVFDRSGSYCSSTLNIRRDFTQFFSAILNYQRMSDQELGQNSIIKADDGGNFINHKESGRVGKFYVESQPIASRGRLFGSGTTCYRARKPDSARWDYVLKFKWRWAQARPEDELLKLAKEKGVWGAISLEGYEEVRSTADLRAGLRWGRYRKFARTESNKEDSLTYRQQQAITSEDSGFADYTEESNQFLRNYILTYVITSPLGRPFYTFRSLLELLQVFHDAIRCHRSLYQDAKILHQDISQGNIIILDDQDKTAPKGILIDLDSALTFTGESALGPEGSITGTKPFMAIGVLKCERHTYRHDLESFLYLFLWSIITDHTESPPKGSILRYWSRCDRDQLATTKSIHMQQDFGSILAEFTPAYHSLKPLAERLRRLLFPLRDGTVWTGTDASPEATDKLYDGMITAFQDAIASHGGR